MSHYFKNDATLNHDVTSFDVVILNHSFKFYTDAGVFSKRGLDYGSKVLIENLVIKDHIKDVLDVGCGYGPIGISLAKVYPNLFVTMIDINERAIEMARKNAQTHNVSNVEIKASDLFSNVSSTYDLILSNPPIRAGKQTIFKLYEDAEKHLNPGGLLCVVIQKKQGAPSTFEHLKTLFSWVEIVKKDKGYWVILSKKQ